MEGIRFVFLCREKFELIGKKVVVIGVGFVGLVVIGYFVC